MAKTWARAALVVAGLIVAWLGFVAYEIILAGRESSRGPADVAIVLGAAVHGDQPSPVFRERIRHGIALYRTGAVQKLLLTGGRARDADVPEALVARDHAISKGVPPDAILTETSSRTTFGNLTQARRIMRASDLNSALIVSDPLHQKRAMKMALSIGIEAAASPTPTTRYRTRLSKAGFLMREVLFYHLFLLAGR